MWLYWSTVFYFGALFNLAAGRFWHYFMIYLCWSYHLPLIPSLLLLTTTYTNIYNIISSYLRMWCKNALLPVCLMTPLFQRFTGIRSGIEKISSIMPFYNETNTVTFHAVIAWAGSFGLFYWAVSRDPTNTSLHSCIRLALLLKFLYAIPVLVRELYLCISLCYYINIIWFDE